MFGSLSRHELALTLCEHWGWEGATGKPQRRSCEKMLERLEKEGLLELPARRGTNGNSSRRTVKPDASIGRATDPGVPVEGLLSSVRPVHLERVEDRETKSLWAGFVERYHFLGYKRPFGCTLRYFVTSPQGRLGCLLVASGARALAHRDRWIGWTTQQRLSNLPYVINNSRFVLFPWVRVPNLASHVLGQLASQVQQDWYDRWNYRPVLLETFVDPARHRGTCYRAAGWEVLGETTGGGLKLRGHSYSTTRKLILVRPLVHDFRVRLLT